ncbi:MAG: SRPBCC domain-containing protein [Acidimicrobiales bacterium]
MDGPLVRSVAVSRDIPAPARVIFTVLANPSMHPLIDGTGMAQRADETSLTKVGDVFVMHMTHWSMGDYGMENHVVEFVPDRRIVWEPRRHVYETSAFPGGGDASTTRYWGWELEPLGANLTRVTEFFDGSRLFDGLKEFLHDGEFWRRGMVESLENLERLAMGSLTANHAKPQDIARRRNYFEEVRGGERSARHGAGSEERSPLADS